MCCPASPGSGTSCTATTSAGCSRRATSCLSLAAVAAVVFFPAARDRRARLFGPVTWVIVATGGFVAAGLVVGLYALHNPDGSLVGLRPYYNCVLAAFVVWRVLRSMPRERAERVVLGASLVVGILLVAIGAARVFGIAGTAVEIDGVPITFFDSAGPYALLCCVGVWGAALADRRVDGAGADPARRPRRLRADRGHHLPAAVDPDRVRDRRGGAADPQRGAPGRGGRAVRAHPPGRRPHARRRGRADRDRRPGRARRLRRAGRAPPCRRPRSRAPPTPRSSTGSTSRTRSTPSPGVTSGPASARRPASSR